MVVSWCDNEEFGGLMPSIGTCGPGTPSATGSLPPISRRALAIGLVLGAPRWRSIRPNDDRFSPTTECGQLCEKDQAALQSSQGVDPVDDELRLDCRG